ncbi:MAG: hypothetical protein IKB28_00375 [Clostridia bacterium]|nr:hypothetical protein [Clostridia bacterium]
MFFHECKKLVSNRLVLGMFTILFVLNVLLSYNAAKHEATVELSDGVLAALETYNDDSIAWQIEFERLETYHNEVFLPQKKKEMEEFYRQNPNAKEYYWELDEDAEKYWDYYNAKRYMAELDTYTKDLKRVAKAAAVAKEDYLASGVTENDYEYKYQSDIERIYEVNALIPIDYEYAVGWDEYHAYTSGNVLLVMLMLVLAPGLCIEEFSSGMYPILHATKKGRLHTFLCKLGALALFTTLAVVLFTATTLAFYGASYGFSSLGNFVQVFEDFKFCPEIITVGELLAVSVLTKILVLFALGTLIMLLSVFIKKYALTFVASLGAVAVNFVLYFFISLEQTGSFDMLNLFTVMDTKTAYTRYYSLNVFEESVPYIPLSIGLFAALALTFAALSAFAFCRTQGAVKIKTKKPIKLPARAIPMPCHTLFGAEMGKLLLANKFIIIVVIVLLAKGFIAAETFTYTESFTDSVYKEYMTTLSGELTEEKLAYMDAERNRIDTAKNGYNQVLADYYQGKISQQEYLAFIDEYNYAKDRDSHFARIENRRDYILSAQTAGKDAYFVYDTGWNTLFNQGFDYLLYGLVLLLFAGVFANEIRGGIHNILKATGKGRWRLFLAKYAAVLTLTTILFAAFTAIDLTAAMKSFELPAWDAPIQSITMFGSQPSMTVAQFVALWIAVKWLAVVLLVTALTGISLLSGKVLNTMAIVATVTLMPFLLRRFGLAVAQYFDFTYLLEGTGFLTTAASSALYLMLTVAVLAAAITILTWLSKRSWVGSKNH